MTNNAGVTQAYPSNHIRPHAVNAAGSTNFTYDDNGSMVTRVVSGQTTTYGYDPENRMVSAAGQTSSTYEYADSTERIKKVSGGSTTYYVGELYEEKGSDDISYIYMGSQRVASVINGTVMFYLADHLGGSNILSGIDGVQLESSEYLPYGEFSKHTQSGPANQKSRYYFTDQYLDDESGLYYYNARYYNPAIARFIQADSIVPDYADPQSLNRFSYVLNNPLSYVDPSGNIPILLDDNQLDNVNAISFNDIGLTNYQSTTSQSYLGDGQYGSPHTTTTIGYAGVKYTDNSFYGSAYNNFASGLNQTNIFIGNLIAGGAEDFEKAMLATPAGAAEAGTFIVAGKFGGAAFAKIKFAALAFAKFGNNKIANKQVDAVAQQLKMSPIQRKEFGDYIESLKDGVGKGGADNFSFKDLEKLGDRFLELFGK